MKLSILKQESTNRAIVYSMSLSFIAKMMTFLQSVVISLQYGTQNSTDILFYALSIIFMLMAFTNAINNQVLIPTAISIRNKDSEKESQRFVSFVYLLYILAGVVITALMFISPGRVFSMFSQFSPADIDANSEIIKYILLSFFFIIVNSYILDIFTSYKFFTAPMLIDIVKSSTIIVFVIAFENRYSVTALAMGVFFASLLQFLILNFMFFKVMKFKLSFKSYHIDMVIRKNIGYVVTGTTVAFVSSFIIIYLLSGFQEGVYTAMDYGKKMNVLISSVVIGQLSTVIGINIIEMYAKGEYGKLNDVFMRYLKLAIFLMMPLCFILSLSSTNIISVLFGRGEFTWDSVTMTSGFFMFFIIMLPFKLIDAFLVRLIIAKQIQRIAFLWQISYNLFAVPLIWVILKYTGYLGYPAGELAATVIYVFVFTFYLIKTQFGFIDYKGLLKFIAVNFLMNSAIMLLLRFTIVGEGSQLPFFKGIASIMLNSLAYTVIFLAAAFIYKNNRIIMIKIFGNMKNASAKLLSALQKKIPPHGK